ncbi:short chain dehydrogenase [Hirsutella rhossiliensis]|uniref:Short chain dehydrogenase domain-containing protein n=1 Tax=Hirsutella rhossiliensis TaxID=111463 RepID=A0A9P8SK04_9HYPO|nr:short chain dehydrogenase domain-containing protein [Hirsutella rhossiliensis]KAH0964250.1 short chain dehydrogenase domain-containing protein [Hirsutella rhossiliensis]
MSSGKSITLDAVAATVRRWLLNPKIAVPLALSLHWRPVFALLLSRIAKRQAAKLRSRVRLIATASVIVVANEYLTKQFANNWVRDTRWNWDDEIVVVTGGSSGLGASITQRLIARNCRTRIVVIDFQPLQWTLPADARVHLYQCDLSDSSALRATCLRVRQEVGHPSVLFNNAGLARGFTVLEGEPADVEITMRTNLIAPFLLAKEFLPEMVRRDHGHIVNIGSLSALVSAANLVDYSATKAGLATLHEGLQLELKACQRAPRVRLTLGVFGFIQTPIFSGSCDGWKRAMPLLDADDVGERLVEAVYSGYGSTIYLPLLVKWFAVLRGGPEWLFRLVRERSLGLNLDFKGRQQLDDKTGGIREIGVGNLDAGALGDIVVVAPSVEA